MYHSTDTALVKGGRQNEALNILRRLAENAITESRLFSDNGRDHMIARTVYRFSDASYYKWLLAKSCLDAANKIPEGWQVANTQYLAV